MNFFGHAIVASWYEARPDFVLGAMLPDFSSMLGRRHTAVCSPVVEQGISFHHATDAAFHELPAFVALTSEARRNLLQLGLGRGAARATAHIGVEVLLDEALAGSPGGTGAYLHALSHAASPRSGVAWADPEAERDFAKLIAALQARGVPSGEIPPEHVAERLRRALWGRPRLALGEGDEARVRDWVVGARAAVVGCAPVIATELRARVRPHRSTTSAAEGHSL